MLTCLDAALEYADQGFSVIPVRRDTKRPFVKWEKYQTEPATSEEIYAWWEEFPSANVAIITGAVSGLVVVDADGPTGQQWIIDNLPRTSVYQKTAKGIHAIYKHPGGDLAIGNRGRLAPEVDVRGDGGYIVAAPSVHESGHVYQWVFTEGLYGWDGLTDWPGYISPAKASQAAPGGNLQVDLTGVRPALSCDPVAQGSRNDTLARLVGSWVAKGLSIDEILLMAGAWNDKCQPPLGQSEVEQTVRSICQTHVRNTGQPIGQPVFEAEELHVPEAITQTGPPPALLNPGGLLQEIMTFIDESSAASFPLFNLGAALALIGTLVGQKIMTETGLRTNLYIISLADSGTGKDAPLSAVKKLLAPAGGTDLVGPNHITSGAALLTGLMPPHERQIALLDEIGDIMAGLKNPRDPKADIPRILKGLFSSTDRSEIKNYADSKQNIVLLWHHLSLYATGSPERFWETLTYGDVTDGFLARVLILESDHEPPMPRPPRTFAPAPWLVDAIKALNYLDPPKSGGNLSAPAPVVVCKTPDAAAWFDQWALTWFTLRNQYRKSEDGRAAIYGRAAEHCHKLALIYAVSRVGANIWQGQVTIDDVQKAAALVDYIIPAMVNQIERNISVNELDQLRRRILKVIANVATKAKPGATKRELIKGVRGLTSKQLDEVLNTAILAGDIAEAWHTPARGPETMIYGLLK